MVNPCQPIFINNLYGLLKINTTDSTSCLKSRQWYFFYNYGYTLLIRFINLTHLILNTYIFKIYSIKNEEKTLVYELTNETVVSKEFRLDLKDSDSEILIEFIAKENEHISQGSSVILIDYVFREMSQSHFRRKLLQDNSSPSSFNPSQPAFIALLCVIAVLLVAIIITIAVLSYRYCSQRKTTKKRPRSRHLPTSATPSSSSSYSIRSTQQLFPNPRQANEIPAQMSFFGQSHSTVPSIIPSRRLQQSMIDAYLNDYHSFQPTATPIDPKQLNPYLFIDLHSTSSETFPERNSKKHSYANTTTSGYDTSTGGEERNNKHSFRYHQYRRRRSNQQLRQRRRSTLAFKRSHGPRFLMRERSLPNTLIRLPQLRQLNPLFHIQDQSSSSSGSAAIGMTNQELISTSLSVSSNNYTEESLHYIRPKYPMNNIDEKEKSPLQYPTCFIEKVSIHRGDESDMPNYEDLPNLLKPSCSTGDGIAYINESIIV